MRVAVMAKLIPVLVGAGGVLLAGRWTLSHSQVAMALRVPGTDRIGIAPTEVKTADLQGQVVKGEGQAAEALGGSWPHFRGANLDNIAPESERLPAAWPKAGPTRLWSVNTGEGYAGAAVHRGRVYLMDYDQAKQADTLRCLSLADGREIWNRSYPMEVKRNHGMSRTVPAVTDHYVVTLGPKCHVSCADAVTGEFRWGIDLVADYGSKVPPWYAGQCPLIVGDRVILAPGGADALLMAVELSTGKVIWKTPNPHNWEMTHSSIMPMHFRTVPGEAGVAMYLYCGSGGVVGVSAADGSILWETSQWKVSLATVPAPVVVGDDRLLLTGGYGAGAMMLRLKKDGEKISSEVVYQLPAEVFGAEQQTPIYYKGFVYGVIPGGQLVCLDPADGKQRWNSGSQHFGVGPFMICNDQILLVNDSGTMTAAEATPAGFHALGQWMVIDQAHESWGPMALAGGRLLVRDLRHLACLNLREAGHEQ